MTAAEKIKKFILDNPSLTNEEVATACDSTYHYVVKLKGVLRKEGKLSNFERRKPKEKHIALLNQCEAEGIPVEDVRHYWHKGKHFSIFVKGQEVDLWTLKDEMIKEMQKYAPKYPAIKYPKIIDGHLLVIDPADIHIGKLCKAFETGDEYNHKIAIERVKSGIKGILQKVQGFPIDQILIILGNDILHVDNPKSTTTSGTFQDTELMWYDAFRVAYHLLVECVEMLIPIAPVHVKYDPSNHDYIMGFFLMQALEAWFRNTKSITFDVSIAHRKYYKYGKNLIGSTHGDGAKEQDLGYLMAHESKDWNECKHRYFYVHHIHHKKSKDYMSVCVEALRSPSGTDSWHHRNGYQHAPKAIEGFLHHKEHGQVARITHLF